MNDDLRWLRYAISLARRAVTEGDTAFGTVIVDAAGNLLVEAVQTVERSGNWLAHAEMNALQEAASRFTRDELRSATLYTSAEPCPMCTGAIGWSMSRMVYGLSQAEMYRVFLVAKSPPRFIEPWSCRGVLEHMNPPMEVLGPLLEDEAAEPHRLWIARWLRGDSLGVR
jgi:tRNA(Arg) A34 adenosine deaminase TadA